MTEKETEKLREVAHELALTRQMRGKVVALKRERHRATQKALTKQKLKDLHNISKIVEEVSRENLEKKEKSAQKEQYVSRPGKEKYEGQEIVYHLPDEVPETLRQIKKQGSLIVDAFDSVLRRNLVEFSTAKKTQKKRVKSYDTRAARKNVTSLKKKFGTK